VQVALGNQWGKKVAELASGKRKQQQSQGWFPGPEVVRLLDTLPREAIVTTEVGSARCGPPTTILMIRGRFHERWTWHYRLGFPRLSVKAARPDVPVVDIAGDGSFGMTENSMATSVEEELPVVVVVLNNQMLGMVAQWQRLFFDHRYSAVKLKGNPNMVKLAEAYGAEGVRVDSLGAFEAAVRRAIKSDVSTSSRPIDPEENVYPIVRPARLMLS
jgi:acetolactate synthase-1/2/3 large subunit